jgi:hypothetical protein
MPDDSPTLPEKSAEYYVFLGGRTEVLENPIQEAPALERCHRFANSLYPELTPLTPARHGRGGGGRARQWGRRVGTGFQG